MVLTMIGILIFCLIIGVPVGFSIGISSMSFLLMKGSLPLGIIPQKMIEGVDSFPLMALPLFVFAGELMGYGSSKRLMKLASLLVGRIPGGLGAAACIGAGFFGAVSGSAVATTAAVGGIMAPEMVQRGYSKSLTASLIAGAGVMGMVIPPSFSMVVYGAIGSVSIADLFLAGFVPGFLVIGLLVLFSIVVGERRGYIDRSLIGLSRREKIVIFLDALPPLFMPILILGGVFSGIMTPTESAAIAVIYSLFLGVFVYREITLKRFINLCTASAITTSIIMFIISNAAPFGWIVAIENIPKLFAQLLLAFSTNQWIVLLMIIVLLLLLGTFMEGTSLIILLTPILLPIAKSFGVDPIQFGIVMMLAMAIGGITPPLAVSLFVSIRIVGIKVDEVFPELLYVLGIEVFVLLLTMYIPDISMLLPRLFH